MEPFIKTFDKILIDIVQDLETHRLPKEGIEWIKKVFEYNCLGGKMNRGISVVETFILLNSETNEEQVEQARILGWCVEILQAFFLVADDIMDHSLLRRGQKCWYLKEGVGNIAINDSFILEACVYKILKKYFRRNPNYLNFIELFLEATFNTELGQLMDLTTSTCHADISTFSLEKYKLIVLYKTSFYSFYLPVVSAMLLSGINDEKVFKEAEGILLPLGEFFQIQDDYLDCFGDPSIIGKIGTDIQDNKCSWLVVKALEMISSSEKEQLKKLYGKAGSVDQVKELYAKIGLKECYSQYEIDQSNEIYALIDKSDVRFRKIYFNFAKKIIGRSKKYKNED